MSFCGRVANAGSSPSAIATIGNMSHLDFGSGGIQPRAIMSFVSLVFARSPRVEPSSISYCGKHKSMEIHRGELDTGKVYLHRRDLAIEETRT